MERNNMWLVFIAVGTGLFATVSAIGATTVALPTIAEHFGTDLPTTQWVIVAYALTISAALLPMGRLSDILGRKRIYIIGFCIFTIASVATSLAVSMRILILARVCMGIGAAMTQGPAMAMMISAFPPEERGKALGLQMSAVGMGSVSGPALGGIIVSFFGWQGVFLFVSALGLVSVATAVVILSSDKDTQTASKPRFDWAGAVLSAMLLVAFLLTMSSAPKRGWSSPLILGGFGAVVVLLAAFLWWERRCSAPMLDLGSFTSPQFTIGVSARFITFLGVSSAAYLLPFFVQSVMGYSARQFGLISIPPAIVTIVVAPLSGRIADRYGWRKPVFVGLCLSAAGLLLLARLTASSALLFLTIPWVVQRLGHGTFTAPNNSSVLAVVEKDRYAVTASFLNMVRNAGNVMGTALAAAVVTAVMVSQGLPPVLTRGASGADPAVVSAFMRGMRIAFVAPAILIGCSLLMYLLVRSEKKQPATG